MAKKRKPSKVSDAEPEFKSRRSKPLLEHADSPSTAQDERPILTIPKDGDNFQCACARCEHFTTQPVKWKTVHSAWACTECGEVTIYKGAQRIGTKSNNLHLAPQYCGMF